jgi:hypothetical protein
MLDSIINFIGGQTRKIFSSLGLKTNSEPKFIIIRFSDLGEEEKKYILGVLNQNDNDQEQECEPAFLEKLKAYGLPNANKAIENPKVKFVAKDLPDNEYGYFSQHENSYKISFDQKTFPKPSLSLALILEHEAIHLDQSISKPNYRTHIKPQDSYKTFRVNEIEARAVSAFSILERLSCDPSTIKELDSAPAAVQIFPVFEAYNIAYSSSLALGRNNTIGADFFDVLPILLDRYKQSTPIKKQEMMDKTILTISRDKELLKDYTADYMEALTSFVDNLGNESEPKCMLDSVRTKPQDLFQSSFNQDDALKHLRRNNPKTLTTLKTQEMKEFWRNICNLGPEQRQQVEGLKLRAGDLRQSLSSST